MKRIELPGYFYDETKKKYFKITKEFKVPKKLKVVSEGRNNKKANFLLQMYGCSLQKITQNSFKRDTKLYLLRKTLSGNWIVDENSLLENHGVRIIKFNSNGTQLAMCSMPYNNYSHFAIKPVKLQEDCKSESEAMVGSWDNVCVTKVTLFVWCPWQHDRIIYLERCRTSHLKRDVVKLYHTCTNNSDVVYSSKQSCFRSVEWSSFQRNIVSIGTSCGKVLCLDVLSEQKICRSMFIERSSIEVMRFFESSPCLIIGCQSGALYYYDLRRKSSSVVIPASQKTYSNDCLKTLNNENYFLYSDWGGNISKVDLRMNKVCLEYKHHVNNHSRLEFHVDESEDFLYAIGSDAVFRAWDQPRGNLHMAISLEESIPVPEYLPTLAYTSTLAGLSKFPALLCYYDRQYKVLPLS